jgi:hypothetical protein
MGVNTDGSPKQTRGRMAYGTTSKQHRSSKARSSISGGSWEQSPLLVPLSLRQASFNTPTKTAAAAKVRHAQKMKLSRPPGHLGSTRLILAPNQGSEQARPFDAFVDVPSPFAKRKVVAKSQSSSEQNHTIQPKFTNTSIPVSTPQPHPHPTSPLPCPYPSSGNETGFSTDAKMDPYRMRAGFGGHLDARTRADNLLHTRPEWTTWDFVDLFLCNLPPAIRTVDLWNNFSKEGKVDLIDIFVTRGGQKDNKATVRFR